MAGNFRDYQFLKVKVAAHHLVTELSPTARPNPGDD